MNSDVVVGLAFKNMSAYDLVGGFFIPRKKTNVTARRGIV